MGINRSGPWNAAILHIANGGAMVDIPRDDRFYEIYKKHMTIQRALEYAIEGGWKVPHVEEPSELEAGIRFYTRGHHKVILDPLFWQALGTRLGWKDGKDYQAKGYMRLHKDGTVTPSLQPVWSGWQYAWHGLIHHLVEDGTIESYFETLPDNQESE